MSLPSIGIAFPTRLSRSEFVSRRFAPYLRDTVLDVGCFEAPLRDLLKSVKYTGVDFAGRPDIQLNLETTTRLPFDDGAFTCVLCIDVLEHLDNLHAVFDELVRVSGRYVIVSLPNCWCDARRAIERGKGQFAHYGLPAERPPDRHKWFFNLDEANRFLEARAAAAGLSLAERFVAEKPRAAPIRLWRRLLYPGWRYLNRYGRTLWAVLEKTG
ncbi:MAG: methyltransferase domain-containing protein [Kiritimatiellae bacterium]|nr:methyltransferase domain-containing protein [Kiritimatiellia bacterium]